MLSWLVCDILTMSLISPTVILNWFHNCVTVCLSSSNSWRMNSSLSSPLLSADPSRMSMMWHKALAADRVCAGYHNHKISAETPARTYLLWQHSNLVFLVLPLVAEFRKFADCNWCPIRRSTRVQTVTTASCKNNILQLFALQNRSTDQPPECWQSPMTLFQKLYKQPCNNIDEYRRGQCITKKQLMINDNIIIYSLTLKACVHPSSPWLPALFCHRHFQNT